MNGPSNNDNIFDNIRPILKQQTLQIKGGYNEFEQKLLKKKLEDTLLSLGFPSKFVVEKNLALSLFPSFSIPFFAQHANQRDTSFNLNWNFAVDYAHARYVAYSDIFITDKNNAQVINIAVKKLNNLHAGNFINTKIEKSIKVFLN